VDKSLLLNRAALGEVFVRVEHYWCVAAIGFVDTKLPPIPELISDAIIAYFSKEQGASLRKYRRYSESKQRSYLKNKHYPFGLYKNRKYLCHSSSTWPSHSLLVASQSFRFLFTTRRELIPE
jgi:hypothetical protein